MQPRRILTAPLQIWAQSCRSYFWMRLYFEPDPDNLNQKPFPCHASACMPRVAGRLGFKFQVQVCCLLCCWALSESMPPRTLVHCPGCPRTYASEAALRKHRGHRCSVGTPCFLDIHQPARVSRWVAGAGAGPGRLQITEMDMFGAQSRSPSPDPGDDEGPPPPDFDEDDLGPPALPPQPAPAPAVCRNLKSVPWTAIHSDTYQYMSILLVCISYIHNTH